MPGKSKFQISRSLDERIKRILTKSEEFDSEYDQASSAYILGFNFGNVTNCVGLTTNYQLKHAVFPVVGLVFFKTCPSDEEIKSSLESIKEFSSSPNGLGSFKSDKNEHLFLIYSVERGSSEVDKRIFNFSKGSFVRRRRLRLDILDDPYCPRQVHRGSEDFFNLGDGDSYTSADDDHVDHLIFFIHGVGGVCDVRFRSCVEVVADFKKLANNLLAQHSSPPSGSSSPSNRQLAQHFRKGFFRRQSSASESGTSPSSEYTDAKSTTPTPRSRRVECLPISWHSCTRKQSGMNDQLSSIALSSVPKLRHFLNKVVMDALLYSSGPVYSQAIINNVGDEINRLYTIFMEKHPNFTGSVSLAGHSLGSVIVFDLLAHQVPDGPSTVEPQTPINPVDPMRNDMQYNETILNNNNNNNDIERETLENAESSLNWSRRNCGNVSHNHHLSNSELESGDCSDYKNLEELLKDMNLFQFADLFYKEHIDLKSLLLLTDKDMKELNLPLGARRKLGTYINFKKVSLLCRASLIHKNTQQLSDSEKHRIEGEKINKLLDKMNTGQYLVKYPQLKFKPRCFFSFGSPMPMFLNVRGIQNISGEYKLPTCDRMMNIFHPYDPLAYRIEPLIDARFKDIEPILLPHHRGGKRIHVQLREGFAKVGHDIKHRLLGSLRDTWSSFKRFNVATPEPTRSPSVDESLESRKRFAKSASSSVDVEVESFDLSATHSVPNCDRAKSKQLKRNYLRRSQSTDLNVSGLDSIIENSLKKDNDSIRPELETADALLEKLALNDESRPDSPIQSKCQKRLKKEPQVDDSRKPSSEGHQSNRGEFDSTTIGRLNGGRRLDYVLQEKPIELFNEYIFAFTSHANYWQNEDSALTMLNEIYQGDNIQLDNYD